MTQVILPLDFSITDEIKGLDTNSQDTQDKCMIESGKCITNIMPESLRQQYLGKFEERIKFLCGKCIAKKYMTDMFDHISCIANALDNDMLDLKYDQFDSFKLSHQQIQIIDKELFNIVMKNNIGNALYNIKNSLKNRTTMSYVIEYYCPTFDWKSELNNYEKTQQPKLTYNEESKEILSEENVKIFCEESKKEKHKNNYAIQPTNNKKIKTASVKDVLAEIEYDYEDDYEDDYEYEYEDDYEYEDEY